jgi:hypothetical protein
MSGRWTVALGAALVGLGLPAASHAQACRGLGYLEGNRFHVAAAAASYTYADAVGASLTAGGPFFGTLAIARAHDRELHASVLDVGVEAGYDLPVGAARRWFVCPAAGIVRSDGPKRYLFETDMRRWDVGLCLDTGWVLLRSGALTLVPTAGVRVQYITNRYRAGGLQATEADTYQRFDLALGIGVREVLTVRPGISVPVNLSDPASLANFAAPFGREEGEIGLEITVGVRVGPRSGRP